MDHLRAFVDRLSGRFDNSEQLAALQRQGIADFPYAEHVNTACNDKILGLPADFSGLFLVEESYYTLAGKTNSSSHLFLFTEEGDKTSLPLTRSLKATIKRHFRIRRCGLWHIPV